MISAVQGVAFFRKLSCWFFFYLQDSFCLVQEYVLATLCFSISSCRDDVARVAGLALHGRCKVVVRVCGFVVMLFHVECCYIIAAASCGVMVQCEFRCFPSFHLIIWNMLVQPIL